MRVGVKFPAAEDAASKIEALNNQLQDKLGSVTTAVERVQNSWEGEASTKTVALFNGDVKQAVEAQAATIRNFVRFLRVGVIEGGKGAEKKGMALAEAFDAE